ncbi:hypothetical protein K438DRAFT_341801 [Mycena galopus ATCC 62051]|nr:hypothetical protein K438DRAFT_341801 [Mycena galopus ATCC 62051]
MNRWLAGPIFSVVPLFWLELEFRPTPSAAFYPHRLSKSYIRENDLRLRASDKPAQLPVTDSVWPRRCVWVSFPPGTIWIPGASAGGDGCPLRIWMRHVTRRVEVQAPDGRSTKNLRTCPICAYSSVFPDMPCEIGASGGKLAIAKDRKGKSEGSSFSRRMSVQDKRGDGGDCEAEAGFTAVLDTAYRALVTRATEFPRLFAPLLLIACVAHPYFNA